MMPRVMANEPKDAAAGYVFDRSRADEEVRLEAQSRVIDPFTERLFRDAGLASGMRS